VAGVSSIVGYLLMLLLVYPVVANIPAVSSDSAFVGDPSATDGVAITVQITMILRKWWPLLRIEQWFLLDWGSDDGHYCA
jgi:hypothetical protein